MKKVVLSSLMSNGARVRAQLRQNKEWPKRQWESAMDVIKKKKPKIQTLTGNQTTGGRPQDKLAFETYRNSRNGKF